MKSSLIAAGLHALSTTPTPGPGNDGLRPGLSADQVSPGFLGFLMTAFMVIAVVMLMVSMTRRIRRVRYQAQFSTAEQDGQAVSGETDATAVGEPTINGAEPPGENRSHA